MGGHPLHTSDSTIPPKEGFTNNGSLLGLEDYELQLLQFKRLIEAQLQLSDTIMALIEEYNERKERIEDYQQLLNLES